MIDEGSMSTREELHQAVDALQEDQIADVIEYIEDLQAGLRPETVDAIREGLSDIEQGRVMSVEEYRRISHERSSR